MTSAEDPDFDSPPGRMVTVKAASCAVIGDIHGRADLLERLLARIPKTRRVLVAGDLCDRGPDARGVLDLLIARGARGALGNHEEWLLRWARGDGFIHEARAMGATATLASYGVTAKDEREVSRLFRNVPRDHVAFLESLGHVVDLRVGDGLFWVIHAGIGTTSSLAAAGSVDGVVPYLLVHAPDVLLWGHTAPEATLPVARPVVMGHLSAARAKGLWPRPRDRHGLRRLAGRAAHRSATSRAALRDRRMTFTRAHPLERRPSAPRRRRVASHPRRARSAHHRPG